MKIKVLFISCISTLILAPSCIKQEGLDREADIISVSLEDKGFLTSVVNDNTREISIIMGGNIKAYEDGIIVPQIETSPRSTISPNSLEPVRLKNYKQTYTVTAEDGGQKSYELVVSAYKPLIEDFEHWNTVNPNSNKPYLEPADPLWDCGNSGINIIYPTNTPFPTRKIEDKRPGSEGEYSAFLETTRGKRSDMTDIMDIPVFSGSMFRGFFAIKMSDPLSSTNFGQPHPRFLGRPIALTAWYKYTAGSPYVRWERNGAGKKVVTEDNATDTFDLYAVLFKVSKDAAGSKTYLTGHNINKFNENPLIVAYTPMKDQSEKKDWENHKAKFIFKEDIDFDKNDYKLAIVLASSSEGANYMGAIGSTLIVDDLRVVFENDEDADEYK